MEPIFSYVICGTPRSGSHLLCEALQNTNLAGNPDEYFITDHEGRLQNETGNIAEQFGKKTLYEFRDFVIGVGSTPNGCFGISIVWPTFHHILRNYQQLPEYEHLNARETIDKLFNNPKYIWLTRRDKVRQAVSLEKAIQTNVWRQSTHETFRAKREPAFAFERIDHWRKRLEEGDAGWQSFFQDHGIVPLKVVYEELVHTYKETALEILDFLGIPHPEPIQFGERRLKKQADQLSEAWVAQYNRMKRSPLTPLRRSATILGRRIRSVSVRRWLRQ